MDTALAGGGMEYLSITASVVTGTRHTWEWFLALLESSTLIVAISGSPTPFPGII